MARVYDYVLGGTNNFAVDRELAEHPPPPWAGSMSCGTTSGAHRRFLVRAVHHLVDQGSRQFLDIGTGIPNDDNVHGAAQQVAPESRIVYVDYDSVVLAHAHELLRSSPEGAAAFSHGDLHEPDPILEVSLDRWHPPGASPAEPADHLIPIYGAIGRKP